MELAETFSPADRGSTLAAFQAHWAVTTFNPLRPGLSSGSSSHNTEAELLLGLVWLYHTGLTCCLYQQAPWLTRLCWSLPDCALLRRAEAGSCSPAQLSFECLVYTSVVRVRGRNILWGCYSQNAWFYCGYKIKKWNGNSQQTQKVPEWIPKNEMCLIVLRKQVIQ